MQLGVPFRKVRSFKGLPGPDYWRRRDVQDAASVAGVALLTFLVAHIFQLPSMLFRFALEHADSTIADLLFLAVLMSVLLPIYARRRRNDLARQFDAWRIAEAEFRRLTRHDPVTGLPNRRFFADRLDKLLRQAEARKERTAVLMLDVDGVKTTNDTFGHGAGDEVLIEFSGRISSLLAPGAFMARVGGDVFAIAVTRTEADGAALLAHRIAAALVDPVLVREVSVRLGVAIGIGVAPKDGTSAEEVLRRADLALYWAKADGRVRFFEPGMDEHMERRHVIECELRDAIAARAIGVHYQPLVRLDTNRIVGFEALARWVSPNLGQIDPQDFIAIAEQCGAIVELGDILLRRACEDAVDWPGEFTLCFNISAVQLRDPGLGLRILTILNETGLDPRRLELEITETALIADAEPARFVIHGLRGAGVRVALDDFGTGYATMSQLLSLRLDKIKIDRTFVSRMGQDPERDVIVRATIGLAKGLGLTTTAEGVETVEQCASLRAYGCTEGQGYLFGRAMPTKDIPALIAAQEELKLTA
jgi:diguanylate cyclase (GGDEF)-like protein